MNLCLIDVLDFFAFFYFILYTSATQIIDNHSTKMCFSSVKKDRVSKRLLSKFLFQYFTIERNDEGNKLTLKKNLIKQLLMSQISLVKQHYSDYGRKVGFSVFMIVLERVIYIQIIKTK